MITVNSNFLPERLRKGIEELETYGFLQDKPEGTVIYAMQGTTLIIEKTEAAISITYDTEPHFYMALMRGIQMDSGKQEIKASIKQLGFMLDCSRNAVAKPEMVKKLIWEHLLMIFL